VTELISVASGVFNKARKGLESNVGLLVRNHSWSPLGTPAALPMDLYRHLAQYVGCALRRNRGTADQVRKQRIRLGVPALRPQNIKKWTRPEENVLGTLADRKIARRLGRSDGGVRAHRLTLGLHKCHLISRMWLPEEEKLLGTAEDKEIARLLAPVYELA